MFILKIKQLFLAIIIISCFLLLYIWYSDYTFYNNPLEEDLQKRVYKKNERLKYLAYKHYNIKRTFPLVIEETLNSRNYGLTTYDKNGIIKIYLNKNRFKENENYMIDDVLPHEYAHAIMFSLKDFTDENSGHSKRWQTICIKLQGINCDRFVNRKHILIEKTSPFM